MLCDLYTDNKAGKNPWSAVHTYKNSKGIMFVWTIIVFCQYLYLFLSGANHIMSNNVKN